MKNTPIILISISLFLVSCWNNVPEDRVVANGKTVIERIKAPDGFEWVNEQPNSFAAYLQDLELEPSGSKILDFNGKPITNQYEHIAIIKKDVGNKDLQQCADAVIRLRADYLWDIDKKESVKFHFTNGDLYSWSDHKIGVRPKLISSNKVEFTKTQSFDNSYDNFRKYLDIVFTYAGTISLNNETIKVTKNSEIEAGNVIVTPGSPGHAVIIVGTAQNSSGDKVYLIAEGYTPAQSIHILTNPFNGSLNPWYKLDVKKNQTVTARYAFEKTNIRGFKD